MKYDQFIDAVGNLADELRFISKSISDDETRYFMQYIHVEYIDAEKPEAGLLAVATDGRRLNVVSPLNESAWKVYGMKPGFYRYLKAPGRAAWLARCEEDPGQFPAWQRVVPTGDPVFKTTFSGVNLKATRGSGIPDLVKLLRAFPEATAMNLKYIEDLGNDTPWEVEWTEQTKAVVFKSGTRKCVIMPMQME